MDISTVSTFFSKHVDTESDSEKFWNRISFIAANEWHWTEEELLSTSIPHLFIVLDGRNEFIKESNKKR